MVSKAVFSLRDLWYIVGYINIVMKTELNDEDDLINNANEILLNIDEMGMQPNVKVDIEELATRLKNISKDTAEDIVKKSLEVRSKVPIKAFNKIGEYEEWKDEREDLILEVFDKYIEE